MKIKRSLSSLQKRTLLNKNPKVKPALEDKLNDMAKSTVGLQSIKRVEDTSSNRCRICVRNLPMNIKRAEIFNLFKDYGPIKELFIKEDQHMLILTLSSRANAERAVTYLNGTKFDSTVLIVRSFRVPAIKVYNLSKHVTNELLHLAFSIFGKIEECYVRVDQQGHCSGEGIVEYETKQSMYAAIKFCRDNSYFLTAYNLPVVVEQYDPILHYDGRPESLVKRTPSYYMDRKIGPRISQEGTFDDYYANLFKELYEEYRFAMSDMKDQFICEQDRLQLECAQIKYDEETEHLKMIIKERERERKRLENLKTQKTFKHNSNVKNIHKKPKVYQNDEESCTENKTIESLKVYQPGSSGDYEIQSFYKPVPAKRQRF